MRIEKEQAQTTNKKSFGEVTRKPQRIVKKQNVTMFMSIFIVLLIVFLGFAKMLSPDIDISLGDDSYNIQEEDNLREIDGRLKVLQAEDDGLLSEEEEALIEEDGYVLIPKNNGTKTEESEEIHQEEVYNSPVQENLEVHNEVSHVNEPVQAPVATPVANVPVAPSLKTYRVYVGMYSSQPQAEVARGILQDAGMGVAPNIKQTSGGYTLQVGAFNSKDAATALANKLLMNNYPARVSSD